MYLSLCEETKGDTHVLQYYKTHPTQKQRDQIQVGIEACGPVLGIARKLGGHRCTVYRELGRGGSTQGHYDAQHAQAQALKRARLSAANNTQAKPPELWRRVRRWLRRDWSPKQIWSRAQRFKLPTGTPPAIYAYVEQERGAGGDLHEHLRYAGVRTPWQACPDRAHVLDVLANVPGISPSVPKLATGKVTASWGQRASGHRLIALVERRSAALATCV